MELIKWFTPEQFNDALSSWAWIGLDGKTPLFTSVFGDVFLGANDGVWWLDTIEGELTREWDSLDELEAELNTGAGQEKYLIAELALALEAGGLLPGPGEIYDFSHPLVLGGELEVENVEVTDMSVSLNILGQIHDQVRRIPPGAKVNIQFS
ncbi:T6SS immunity protein Tdi1 domain-containing protein [Nocardia sp. SYP-A9097]|uniref:T6SS immunity protein Tdi1 domain-containing protein n=1 Tax=Nocardia sp. SYP-A9097 TaxID=2663237 RepID=UPI0018912979|nr:T6SS immunity protein Tdi1 domain-containing protein [Nocardia sp. SYP-A9097]